MKVKKLGNITLTYPLWWVDYNNVPTIQAEVQETIVGGVIVWEQARDVSSYNINLTSGQDGWQDVTTKDAIKALVAGSLGSSTTITLTNDDVINVRFRHEVSGGAVKFDRLVDSELSEFYTCDLFLAKV